nr:unnamed protein product [Callosobruchus chinensis]
MPGCAVATCRNTNRKTKGSDVRYFRFPQDEDLSKQWINVCRRNDTINLKNARICSIHFEQNSFEIPLRQRLLQYSPKNSRTLKCDAMPTLYLPGPSYTTIKKTERHTRFIKRDQQAIVADLLNKNDQLQPSTSREKPVELLGSINIDEMETNIEDVSELVIGRLQEKIKMLEEENKKLKQEVTVVEQSAFQKYEHILATVFTPGQIRKLLDSGKNRKFRWTPEDIASAVSLRSVSPKAYRYLRANKYPLPALSTLRKWVSTFDLGQGILKHVISLMKTKSAELTEVDRLCILPFDEIYISNKVDIDKKDEQVVGPHKASQTCMVRGLFSNWKQPIFYKFDQAMSKDILNEIISNLFHANFIVVAICSDMGAGNVGLWSKLDVGHTKNCSFNHPCDDSLKKFVFADVPHLLKLIRNHLLDHGFVTDNNSVINIDYFQVLLNISTSELTLAHKLTEQHLYLKGSMRQRVRPAAQLLSNTTAKAMQYCGENGLMPSNCDWKNAVKLVQICNDWFDLFNSRVQFEGNCPTKNAFGTNLEQQTKLLNDMTDVMSSVRVGNHKDLIPFQKGIILNNRSISEMFSYLKEKYKIKYILTSRLNQDVLENFFSYIRGMGGPNEHPSPIDFKYRLRWYILGKNSSAIFTENRNTMETDDSCLISVLQEGKQAEEICLTQTMLSKLVPPERREEKTDEENLYNPNGFVEPIYLEDEVISDALINLMDSFEIKEQINMEALRYVAGYVAYRFRNKYPTLGIPTKDFTTSEGHQWLDILSRGALLSPTEELWEVTKMMETIFYQMNGSSLCKEKKIFHNLAQKTLASLPDTSVPFDVILCMCRTRVYIRLRDINRKISFQNCQRRLDRKMSKFTNFKK